MSPPLQYLSLSNSCLLADGQERRCPSSLSAWIVLICLLVILPHLSAAAPAVEPSANITRTVEPLSAALSPQRWQQAKDSVDRALTWLAGQHLEDGSFAGPSEAQPAATSLAVMAFLSRGHIPGEGPYGRQLEQAIDFTLACQRPDGLLAFSRSGARPNGRTASYNHAIAGLMLCEVYGMTDAARAARIERAIQLALQFARKYQLLPKMQKGDEGGWRYLYSETMGDSDLSVTAWQLMFLRSAKNAEFNVPKQFMDDGIGYVLRSWQPDQGVFVYKRGGGGTRGMVGAGMLSLAMAGMHNTRIAQNAGEWLLRYPFRSFGEQVGGSDRFFYSSYYCSQAMAQLGGRYWKQFFPNLVTVLLGSQQPTGEWPPEPVAGDRMFGNTYTTAMAVLSLTPPLQLLPVYQR